MRPLFWSLDLHPGLLAEIDELQRFEVIKELESENVTQQHVWRWHELTRSLVALI